MIPSRIFLAVLFLWCGTVSLKAEESRTISKEKATSAENSSTLWYDIQLLDVEGQGWDDNKATYDRLPAKAEGVVRGAVWSLSRDSAGIAVRFVTDATTIQARWTLTDKNLAMPHMAATGVSGLDLYVRDDAGEWRWLACGQPREQTNELTLVSGIPAGKRTYLMYLPLYNGVSSVEIGIDAKNSLAKAPARPESHQKPIVFYGTSITHGACASRPGMAHPSILGRWFERPIINLGFSGNGRMETEVVELIAEIDAAVFVLDCLPNIGAKEVLERTRPCVEILRKAHPKTPILLVEDRDYSNGFLVTARRERNETSQAALKKVFKEMQEAGIPELYYLEGKNLLGKDNEGTVDSSHPTDLGFMRQAEAFQEVLLPLLQRK